MGVTKTALVTGGASGIGFSISRYFARNGYQLIWVALEEEELMESKRRLQEAIGGGEIHTMAMDLSLPNAAKDVHNWVLENDWEVDVLINNAGFGTFGFVQDIDLDHELKMIQLNVMNVYHLSRLFLPKMLQNNSGTIINISSNSSFQPVPKLSTYASTKAFVNHWTRGVQEELKIAGSKVRMICVCPAAIKDTNFKKVAKMEKVKTFSGMAVTTAEEVAKDVWNGFSKGKSFIVSGWKMRLLYKFSPLLPFFLQQFLVRKEIKEI